MLRKTFLIFTCILFASVSFAQVASYPEYLSAYDVVEWNLRGGMIASGVGDPTGVASEGARYTNLATPSIPVDWRYTSGAWRTISGGGVSDHSLLSNLDYASSGHIGFAAINDIPNNASFTAAGLGGASVAFELDFLA